MSFIIQHLKTNCRIFQEAKPEHTTQGSSTRINTRGYLELPLLKPVYISTASMHWQKRDSFKNTAIYKANVLERSQKHPQDLNIILTNLFPQLQI